MPSAGRGRRRKSEHKHTWWIVLSDVLVLYELSS